MTEEQKKLAEDNHNLIYFYARKYHMSKQDFEDMYGILAIGLCKAARDYDESRGRAFSSCTAKSTSWLPFFPIFTDGYRRSSSK